MLALREIEERTYRAIVNGDADYLRDFVVSDGIPAEARIQVYQNNARESFTKTLAASYPVTRQLVGDACFRTLARQYMLRHPSRSGDLQCYGLWFPAYLALCYRDTEFDYLGDVARLEWALEEVRTAAPAPALELTSLADVAANRYPQLRFWLSPAHRVVSSRYPVFAIWRSNRDDAGDERIDLKSGGEHVLVLARNRDVELHLVSDAFARFVVALGDGAQLADAVGIGCDAQADFDPSKALARLADLGVLSAFYFDACNILE